MVISIEVLINYIIRSEKAKQLIGAKNREKLKGRKLISKDGVRKFVHPEELPEYLNNGWNMSATDWHRKRCND